MTTKTERVTLTIIEGPQMAQDADGWAHNAYTVELRRGSAAMRVPFRTGTGWTDDPTAVDVLECLLSDAAGYDNARDVDDWAAEYGYTDSPSKAVSLYEQTRTQTEQLRTLLGDEYDAAVFPTDLDSDDPNRDAAERLTR